MNEAYGLMQPEHLWRMDADGGNLRQLTNSNFDPPFSYPDYSSDGRWVIYAKSGTEKGIWKIPLEGGDPVRLNNADALMPAVSPDGKIIAFHDAMIGRHETFPEFAFARVKKKTRATY